VTLENDGESAAAARETVIRALGRLCPEGALGIALSGGGDSTALTVIAAEWARATGRRLEAATMDHGLRAEAAAEAADAARLCEARGLAHMTLSWQAPPAPGNLQAEARAARHALIAEWAAARGLAAVLLGHTRDDVAETLLLRLARGSGVDGLAAMAERVRFAGALWLRPCLGVTRAALRAVLRAEGIGWAEDPSNDDLRFDRAKARAALAALAPLGLGVEGLAQTADRLARQRIALEAARARLARLARQWGACGEASLAIPQLEAAEEDTALGVLADTLMQISGAPYRPRFEALERLWASLREPGFRGQTLGGVLVRRDGTQAMLMRELAAVASALPLGPDRLWDRRWRIRAEGPWPAAEIGALGEAGLAEIAAIGGETNRPPGWPAAPRTARATVPAAWGATGTLLACPAAGYRASALDAECKIAADLTVSAGMRPSDAAWGDGCSGDEAHPIVS